MKRWWVSLGVLAGLLALALVSPWTAGHLPGMAVPAPPGHAIPADEQVYAYVDFDGRDPIGIPSAVIHPAAGRAVRLTPPPCGPGDLMPAADGRRHRPGPQGGVPPTGSAPRVEHRRCRAGRILEVAGGSMTC